MENQHIPSPRNTREAVLLTLAYFDAQGLALTAFDIWYNLVRFEASYKDVLAELTLLATPAGRADAIVHVADGYYSLRSIDAIKLRQIKHKVSEFKWRRARIVSQLLSLVPFIEAVAVVDSVALNKAKPESDIDFFIVTRPGRVWTSRLIATGLTHMLRLRRHGDAVRDRACLSFYATSDALDMHKLAIEGGDLYLAQWVNLVSPLWQRHGFDLIDELTTRNTWAAELFPQRAGGELSDRRKTVAKLDRVTRPVQWLSEKVLATGLGTWLEQRVRKTQLKYMHKTAPYELKNRTSHIVISDQLLKFHEQDRRTWFRERTVATYQMLLQGEPLGSTDVEIKFGLSGITSMSVQPVGATLIAAEPAITSSSA